MEKIRNALVWSWLLTKRLYKKPSFIAILILIPLIIAGYGLVAQSESGMMTIAVCCEDSSDSFVTELRDELVNSSSVIRFISDIDQQEATQMVYDGVIDAVWVIHSGLYDRIMDYVSDSYTNQGFVTVIIREQTVPLMLANEKLSAKLFVTTARLCFLNYFRDNASEFDDQTDEKILAYFDDVQIDESLFSFSYVDEVDGNVDSLNYLMLPVRGLLAILVLVSGFSSSMYYILDERDGLFSRIALQQRHYAEFLAHIICVGNVTVFVLLSLFVSGWFVGFLKEIIVGIVYVLCCTSFCRLLRLICKTTTVLSTAMSVLTIIMLIVCPVFISAPEFRLVSLAFPPTYFIHAAYNWSYVLYMALFSLVLLSLQTIFARVIDK